jgi:UDPglucose--hexose-1-phosphate uridylyltransferase
MEIRPRLVTAAGFEIASGVHINHSMPEEDADILRGN